MVKDLFVNAAILISFISIGNQIFKNSGLDLSSSNRLKILSGSIAGLLGVLLMIFSVRIGDSIIVDFRNVAIILSAIYGGRISAAVTVMIIGIFRFCYLPVQASSVIAIVVLIFMATGF